MDANWVEKIHWFSLALAKNLQFESANAFLILIMVYIYIIKTSFKSKTEDEV